MVGAGAREWLYAGRANVAETRPPRANRTTLFSDHLCICIGRAHALLPLLRGAFLCACTWRGARNLSRIKTRTRTGLSSRLRASDILAHPCTNPEIADGAGCAAVDLLTLQLPYHLALTSLIHLTACRSPSSRPPARPLCSGRHQRLRLSGCSARSRRCGPHGNGACRLDSGAAQQRPCRLSIHVPRTRSVECRCTVTNSFQRTLGCCSSPSPAPRLRSRRLSRPPRKLRRRLP
jgi:hypothetical protein